jgi:hypothetical protein
MEKTDAYQKETRRVKTINREQWKNCLVLCVMLNYGLTDLHTIHTDYTAANSKGLNKKHSKNFNNMC